MLGVLQPIFGAMVILAIAVACSTNRRAINWTTVAWGLSLAGGQNSGKVIALSHSRIGTACWEWASEWQSTGTLTISGQGSRSSFGFRK